VAMMLDSIGLEIWTGDVYKCLDIAIYGRISMSGMLYGWWCRIAKKVVHWTLFCDDDALEARTIQRSS